MKTNIVFGLIVSLISSCSQVNEDDVLCNIKTVDKEVLYSNSCAFCHSYYGNMDGAPSLLDFIRNKDSTMLKIDKIIINKSKENIHYQFVDTMNHNDLKKIRCYILNMDTISP